MFNINQLYKFETLAPNILGLSYTDMKVKGIMSADEAIKYRDIVSLQNSLETVIEGLPSNINDLTYVLFVNSNGDKLLLAQEYIDANTVEAITKTNIRISVYDVDDVDVTVLRNRMLELGYNNIEITKF